ncbi:MAG: enoyl-CoA hydratase/isomerase family protein [Burkholderiaceae bacterium]|jgi:enoyl-CoA hydratase/carnithine racemase|nr:enoyl-CoA hydratase/isomerase family protein [Burkholderiaceae bacterium]MCO5104372.1 enoyl-CoA hydratase/isomerase family protein [Burkholderiaceae bacterium]
MEQGHIRLEPLDAIAGGRCVVIHNPGRLNAMSRAMWRDLKTVFEQINADASARCVLVQGEGVAFCAGGDISEYPAFRFDDAALRDFHETEVWGALAAMQACDVPVVAGICGACMGAGVEIASCCDIRIASASARFGAPIARLGFPMAPREAQLVAGAVGETVARQMLLEAAVFSALQMQSCGFVSRVVADGNLAAEALASASRIVALAPQAARLNKQTLRALKSPSTLAGYAQAAMESIVEKAYQYADSPEHREGIEAFLAKRAPHF